jgi:hypothetical protein
MAVFEPPPTYADVVIAEPDRPPKFNPIWLKWFVDIAAALAAAGGSGTGGPGISHNSLNGLQGGNPSERYHITAAQLSGLISLVTNETAILAQANANVTLPHAYAVSSLPSAVTSGQGARAFAADATQTIVAGLGNTVVGGGANKVPVYSDGTNWKIG